ncbi:hypothetical protein RHGRI_007766 [Rhododendron griersonianum]|uniref:Uncharacterized protein n=1 Tax=Rhododendron griersonianum TaxID=479676 RepID=A0AAV6KZV1_9ERIC|nr:hypothetical protein RHGRI_007766 [Rhododendron griersonianum]
MRYSVPTKLQFGQNYAAENPASMLYIKNLVKDVVVDGFYFIFGELNTCFKLLSVTPKLLYLTQQKGKIDHALWPFLLKMIIPQVYTSAIATELFVRLVVLLHDPLAREQQAAQILTALPLNSEALYCLSSGQKVKKLDLALAAAPLPVGFLAESLDVTQDTDRVISLGNAFAKQYELYKPDDEHIALLHRYLCVEMLSLLNFF